MIPVPSPNIHRASEKENEREREKERDKERDEENHDSCTKTKREDSSDPVVLLFNVIIITWMSLQTLFVLVD